MLFRSSSKGIPSDGFFAATNRMRSNLSDQDRREMFVADRAQIVNFDWTPLLSELGVRALGPLQTDLDEEARSYERELSLPRFPGHLL